MVGTLYVALTELQDFSDEIKDALTLFSRQTAVAIENARLYTELSCRVTQLEVLPRIYEKIIAVGIENIDRYSIFYMILLTKSWI